MTKEIFFYKRMLGHLARVYQNVIDLIENSGIPEKYGIDVIKLLQNVAEHDRSKFREPQFSKYVEIGWYYYKKHTGEKYPLDKVLSSSATILHIVTEQHHPEYWDDSFLLVQGKLNVNDRDGLPEVPVDGTKMPLESVAEMVCDWRAVAQERGSSLREWADKNVNKRWLFTDRQVELIYEIVDFFEKGAEE